MIRVEPTVYFNENIKGSIIEEIKKARESVFVAVAWLTDIDIINELILKSKASCDVRILVSSDSKNFTNRKLDKLVKSVKFYTWFHIVYKKNTVNKEKIKRTPFYLKAMHHKFCIVDSSIVITGSANWSGNLEYNRENIIIIEDTNIAQKYISEFKRLINKANKTKNISLPSLSILRKLKNDKNLMIRKRIKNKNNFSKILDFESSEKNRIKKMIAKHSAKKNK